jgi:hypothetical protein
LKQQDIPNGKIMKTCEVKDENSAEYEKLTQEIYQALDTRQM